MENKTHEKEPEISLKQSRLKMLLGVLDSFAEEELTTVRSWLINFKDSIPSTSEPGVILEKEYDKLSLVYVEGETYRKAICRDACEKIGTAEARSPEIPQDADPNVWLSQENIKHFRFFLRDFNKVCWNVGSDWDLFSKE